MRACCAVRYDPHSARPIMTNSSAMHQSPQRRSPPTGGSVTSERPAPVPALASIPAPPGAPLPAADAAVQPAPQQPHQQQQHQQTPQHPAGVARLVPKNLVESTLSSDPLLPTPVSTPETAATDCGGDGGLLSMGGMFRHLPPGSPAQAGAGALSLSCLCLALVFAPSHQLPSICASLGIVVAAGACVTILLYPATLRQRVGPASFSRPTVAGIASPEDNDDGEAGAAVADAALRQLELRREKLASLMGDIVDDAPLRDQYELWEAIEDAVERLSDDWNSIRSLPTVWAAMDDAEAEAPIREQAAGTGNAQQVAAGRPSMLGSGIKLAVLGHRVSQTVRKAMGWSSHDLRISQRPDRPLPLMGPLEKLGGGIFGSSWQKRFFLLTREGLRWGHQPLDSLLDPHADSASQMVSWATKAVRAEQIVSCEKMDHDKASPWGLVIKTNTKGGKEYHVRAANSEEQRKWLHALSFLVMHNEPQRITSLEHTRRWVPAGLEIGGSSAARFLLCGKHAKLLLRAVLKRSSPDNILSARDARPLFLGFQLRVRGTALGQKLPPPPHLAKSDLLHRDVLCATLLSKALNEDDTYKQDRQGQNSKVRRDAWTLHSEVLEEHIEAVTQQVDRLLAEIDNRTETNTHLSKSEAFRQLCNKLQYRTTDGTKVHPVAVHHMMTRRAISPWHACSPTCTTGWGALKCVGDITSEPEESSSDNGTAGRTDSQESLHELLMPEKDLKGLMKLESAAIASQLQGRSKWLLHKLTNNTSVVLRRSRTYGLFEEYLESGEWWHGPPECIEPGKTAVWGSYSTNSKIFATGIAATYVFRAEPATSGQLSDELPFDLILTHSFPARGEPKISASIEDKASHRYGVVSMGEDDFLQEHHKNVLHADEITGHRARRNAKFKAQISWTTEGLDAVETDANSPVLHWTLAKFRPTSDAHVKAQITAASMATLSKMTSCWVLDGLLPSTSIHPPEGRLSMLQKQYWIETFAAAVFERAELPTGPESGWLQAQLAAVDEDQWLDVQLEVNRATDEAASKACATADDLPKLCMMEAKRRFEAKGNWHAKLQSTLEESSRSDSATTCTAIAKAAAFGHASLKDTDIPASVGAAKLAGASTLFEGLCQAIEWSAIRWHQRTLSRFHSMQNMDPDLLRKGLAAKDAVAQQWLNATTPEEILKAKSLKVVPGWDAQLSSLNRSSPEFDSDAALQQRKDWPHWQKADTLHILEFVVDSWIDNVVLVKAKRKVAAKWDAFIGPKLHAISKHTTTFCVIQALIISDGKRDILMAQFRSGVGHALAMSHAATVRVGDTWPEHRYLLNATSANASAMLHVTDTWFRLNGWFFTFVLGALLLFLAVGKADHEARAAAREKVQLEINSEVSLLQNIAGTTYRACRLLMVLFSLVIQIKCFTSSWYYFICAVAAGTLLLLHNIRSIRAIVSLCTSVYIAQHVLSAISPTNGVLHHQMSAYGSGLLATGLGRSLLLLTSKLFETVSIAMLRIAQEPNIILHTALITAPDVLYYWFNRKYDQDRGAMALHFGAHWLVSIVSSCVRAVISGSSKMGLYIAMLTWWYTHESSELDYILRAPYQPDHVKWLLCGTGVAASVHAAGHCAVHANFALRMGVRASRHVLDLATTGALVATVAMTSSTLLSIVSDILSPV